MKRTLRTRHFTPALLLGLLTGLGSAPAYADDTEIYFSAAANTGQNTVNLPNVMLVLDTSQSMSANRVILDDDSSVTRIEALKFKQLLRPGRELSLRLTRGRSAGGFQFELADGDDVFSSGRVSTAPGERSASAPVAGGAP